MCAYKCGINLAPYWEQWYIPALLNHRTADTSNYCLVDERHKICPGGDRIVRLLQFQQFHADYRLMKYLLDHSGLKTINRLYAAWKLFVKILPWRLGFYESHIAFARQSVWKNSKSLEFWTYPDHKLIKKVCEWYIASILYLKIIPFFYGFNSEPVLY